MNTTTYPDLPPLETSSFLRIGKRRFPFVDKRRNSYSRPVSQLKQNQNKKDTRKQLADELWSRLPYAVLELSSELKSQDFVETYVESLNQIGQFGRDVERLVRAICETSLEFRQEKGPTNQESRDIAITNLLEELVDKYKLYFPPTQNVLNANLVAEPVELLHGQLQTALKEAVEKFVSQFFVGLEKLVDGKCVGLIDWVGKNICRYHFFREVVLQENDEVQEVVFGSVRSTNNESWEDSGDLVQRVTEISGGRHFYRHGRHEHHVMDAFHTSIKNSRVVMTPGAKQLLAQIPDWLYRHVQVVDGTIFRERIIEEDYRESQWQDAKTYDVPVVGCEPAVIVDQFVLTGWGPREIQFELDRRDEIATQKNQQRAKRSRIGWTLSALVIQISSIFLIWQAFHADAFWLTPAVVLYFVGLWPTILAMRAHAVVRNVFPGQWKIAAYVWSVALAIAAVQSWVIRDAVGLQTFLQAPLILLLAASLLAAFGVWGFRREHSL